MSNLDCQINGDPSYSDQLTSIYEAGLHRMGQNLVDGKLSLDDWHQQMKDALDKMYVFQGMAGVNGDQSRVDSAVIQRQVAEQYKYLDGFASDIETARDNGGSLGFVPSRAAQYAGSAKQSYWTQAVEVDLPAYPGDGSSECLGNCKCEWSLECDAEGNVLATWQLGTADHCPTCQQRAAEWAPLKIARNE